METCPCGIDKSYETCCEPYLKKVALPLTASALMRSRYTAFVIKDMDYLYDTLEPSSRKSYNAESVRAWAEGATWNSFTILKQEEGEENDTEGLVEFEARYSIEGVDKLHHERASFVKKDKRWYFNEGELVRLDPIRVNKIGRNEPCPCGSGKKYKKCCS
jgi:SEC-C motif-containing protein